MVAVTLQEVNTKGLKGIAVLGFLSSQEVSEAYIATKLRGDL